MQKIFENWKRFLSEEESFEYDFYKDKIELDEEGNVALYHISCTDNISTMDPEVSREMAKGYTKREYKSWPRARCFYFTRMGQKDPSVGRISGMTYEAKIPYDKLYPIYKDPYKLSYPDMKKEFLEITGKDEYDPDTLNVFERVAFLAEELYGKTGFIYQHGKNEDDIIVVMWKKMPVKKKEIDFYSKEKK